MSLAHKVLAVNDDLPIELDGHHLATIGVAGLGL